MKKIGIENLWIQFVQTTYVADIGAIRVEVRVGQPNSTLDGLLIRSGHSCWAFLTAQNPSGDQPEDENKRATARLREELLSYDTHEGWGIPDPPNDHPPEPSFMVLGMSSEAAEEFGRRYGQMAVLTGKLGGVAKLLECGEGL